MNQRLVLFVQRNELIRPGSSVNGAPDLRKHKVLTHAPWDSTLFLTLPILKL